VTDRKTVFEPREDDEDLSLEQETIRDLDVEKESAEQVRGGAGSNSNGQQPAGGGVE
jgi:hypothetical protein